MSKRPGKSPRLQPKMTPPSDVSPLRAAVLAAQVALLLSAVSLVYGPAIDSPLIFDDYNSIETNETIRTLWPLVGDTNRPGPLNTPKYAPTSGRPLVNLSFAFNYWIGGLNPTGYHVVNLVLHLGSTILVWEIMRRTLRLPHFAGSFDAVADWLGLGAAALWALHPLQTEAVIYITQRTELMMGFFYLATLYCSLRYWAWRSAPATPTGQNDLALAARRPGSGWAASATLACLAGMASKEVMVSAPLIVLLFDRAFVSGSIGTALRRSWPLYVGLACSWGLLFWLMFDNPHSDSAGFHLSVPASAWWFTQAKVLCMYLKLVIWPWPLMIHYEMPYLALAEAWPYLLAVGILGLVILLLLWRNHPAGFLGTWVFAILLPTLVIPIITEVAAERRMYLPLAAIVAGAVVGGYKLAQFHLQRAGPVEVPPAGRSSRLAAVVLLALMVSVVYGGVSIRRLSAYQTEMTLWQEVLQVQPHNYMAHANVGLQYYRAERWPESIAHYRESVRLKPDESQTHYDLGLALMKTGATEEAVAHFRDAVRYRPGSPELLNNMGVALFTAGRNDEAIVAFRDAIALQPTMWRAHDNLGSALARAGRLAEAIQCFERALAINPDALDVLSRLANAQAKSKLRGEAVATAQRALDLARSQGKLAVAATIESQLNAFRAAQVKNEATARATNIETMADDSGYTD